MDKVRVFYDRQGNTLTVWFDDPALEHICEEADDDVVLMKDKHGRVIGVEQLNYTSQPPSSLDDMPIEVQML